jgi:hypothetical protein
LLIVFKIRRYCINGVVLDFEKAQVIERNYNEEQKNHEEKLKPVIHEEFEGYGISIKKINLQQALRNNLLKNLAELN